MAGRKSERPRMGKKARLARGERRVRGRRSREGGGGWSVPGSCMLAWPPRTPDSSGKGTEVSFSLFLITEERKVDVFLQMSIPPSLITAMTISRDLDFL